jgi:hypothetical protein
MYDQLHVITIIGTAQFHEGRRFQFTASLYRHRHSLAIPFPINPIHITIFELDILCCPVEL